MQPPGAIISVEVMVKVFITNSNRGFIIFVYFHSVRGFWFTHSYSHKKDRPRGDDLTCGRVLVFGYVRPHIIGPPWRLSKLEKPGWRNPAQGRTLHDAFTTQELIKEQLLYLRKIRLKVKFILCHSHLFSLRSVF